MEIKTIMNMQPTTVHRNDPLSGALQIMHDLKINGIPVVDEQKKLVGFIVKADIYRFLSISGHYESCPIDWAMSKDVITATPNESIKEVAARLRLNDIIAMPIVEEQKVAGLVTVEDIVDYYIGL